MSRYSIAFPQLFGEEQTFGLAALPDRAFAGLCSRRLPQFSQGRRTILATNTTVAIRTSLITDPAAATAAASHLARIGLRAVVGGHVAAVVGIGTVAVQSGITAAIAGEIQCAAVDGEAAVGVHTVTGGYDSKCTSVDDDKAVGVGGKGILGPSTEAGAVGPAGSVEAVVVGGDIKDTVLDGDRQPLNAFIAVRDGEGAALDGEGVVTVDCVIPAAQGKLSGGNDHFSAGVETVIRAVDMKRAAVDGIGTLLSLINI